MRRFIPKVSLGRFLRGQEGTTAIEYALIASGVAGLIIAGVSSLGGSVLTMWTAVAGLFK